MKPAHKLVLRLAFAIKVLNIILCWSRPVIIKLNRYFVGFVVIRVAGGATLNTYGAIAVAYSGGILKW